MSEDKTHINKSGALLSKLMKYLVPPLITVGLCWVMFRSINFSDMMDIIRHECNFWWIGLTLCISIFSHVFRALRWRLQLLALGIKAPRWVLVLSIFGTYAVNLVFPRLGEVWRSGYVAQRQDAPFSAVFGSMVAERLADTVTVLLITLVTFALASTSLIAYIRDNEAAYQNILNIITSPWLWCALAACVAVAWWLLTRKSASGSLLSMLQTFMKGIWQGFAVIAKMPGKIRWLFYTLLIWGCYFVQLYVAFYAFPFTAELLDQRGIVAALVTFTLSSIAMGVPSNGGIGPWQWAVMFALGMYGISQIDAGAFANLVLGTQTLLLILLGIFTFITIMFDKRHNINHKINK